MKLTSVSKKIANRVHSTLFNQNTDYKGLSFNTDITTAHLGGNVRQGDPFTYCPRVWTYLVKRFAVNSVLDLGSGLGFAAHFFHTMGQKVIAVDGLISNVENAIFPTICHDLARGPVRTKVDLVHCHEVVEHIDETHLENLLESLCTGKFLTMTHAMPGQDGYHHVNLQPPEYWISHLQRFGLIVIPEDTKRIRDLAALDGAVYMQRSGLVFGRR
jgi:SAM-dependent methyltransferase